MSSNSVDLELCYLQDPINFHVNSNKLERLQPKAGVYEDVIPHP